MNVTIERDFDFQACVYFENQFLINSYNFTLGMEVLTDSIYEQNIAVERLKFLIDECFHNSVFVSEVKKDLIEKYIQAGLKICTIPEDPYDQIIALILLLKTNAVCENRLKVSYITLKTNLSDGIKFLENLETAKHALPLDGWYNNHYPILGQKNLSKKGKIVKLVKDEWSDINLGWKEKRSKPAEVVFTSKDKKPE